MWSTLPPSGYQKFSSGNELFHVLWKVLTHELNKYLLILPVEQTLTVLEMEVWTGQTVPYPSPSLLVLRRKGKKLWHLSLLRLFQLPGPLLCLSWPVRTYNYISTPRFRGWVGASLLLHCLQPVFSLTPLTHSLQNTVQEEDLQWGKTDQGKWDMENTSPEFREKHLY
jgi:hypothetical protein